ncbi:hypothetical protein [Bacillus pinisoli]|nr:hypothetical protein [Bacillus pinisoli]
MKDSNISGITAHISGKIQLYHEFHLVNQELAILTAATDQVTDK